MSAKGTGDASHVLGKKPKRPLTAYNLFFKDQRQEILRRGSSGGFAALARSIAASWKTVSPEAKEYYTRKAAEDKLRYQREMAIWHGKTSNDDVGQQQTGTTGEQQITHSTGSVGLFRDRALMDEVKSAGQEGIRGFEAHSASLPMEGQTFSSGVNANWLIQGPSQGTDSMSQLSREHQRRLAQLGGLDSTHLALPSRHSADVLSPPTSLQPRRDESLESILLQQHGRQQTQQREGFQQTTLEQQSQQSMLPMNQPCFPQYGASRLDELRNERRMMQRRSSAAGQTSIFTPNSLRQVFESDVDIEPIPSPTIEEDRPACDEETEALMARMLRQEESKKSPEDPRGSRKPG